jgi:hypothetical protein
MLNRISRPKGILNDPVRSDEALERLNQCSPRRARAYPICQVGSQTPTNSNGEIAPFGTAIGNVSRTKRNKLNYFNALWLGRQDSNLRMAASKAAALPLGDAPAMRRSKSARDRHIAADARKKSPPDDGLRLSLSFPPNPS